MLEVASLPAHLPRLTVSAHIANWDRLKDRPKVYISGPDGRRVVARLSTLATLADEPERRDVAAFVFCDLEIAAEGPYSAMLVIDGVPFASRSFRIQLSPPN